MTVYKWRRNLSWQPNCFSLQQISLAKAQILFFITPTQCLTSLTRIKKVFWFIRLNIGNSRLEVLSPPLVNERILWFAREINTINRIFISQRNHFVICMDIDLTNNMQSCGIFLKKLLQSLYVKSCKYLRIKRYT